MNLLMFNKTIPLSKFFVTLAALIFFHTIMNIFMSNKTNHLNKLFNTQVTLIFLHASMNILMSIKIRPPCTCFVTLATCERQSRCLITDN